MTTPRIDDIISAGIKTIRFPIFGKNISLHEYDIDWTFTEKQFNNLRAKCITLLPVYCIMAAARLYQSVR